MKHYLPEDVDPEEGFIRASLSSPEKDTVNSIMALHKKGIERNYSDIPDQIFITDKNIRMEIGKFHEKYPLFYNALKVKDVDIFVSDATNMLTNIRPLIQKECSIPS